MGNIKYLIAGLIFGIIITKAEVVSWFRIQDMFRFKDPYMFLILGSAVITGAISVLIIKKFKINNFYGEAIVIPKKKFNKGYIFGGIIFGMGWFLSGLCPGPMAALIGAGYLPVIFAFIAALLGTYTYSFFRNKLPH
ncbi:MAG TPA: YeeE/YedE thiosulfate transporter family protein [Ignavibacteria bacterium]|nr:YeeE/YedE thiosulfate transporter family protein [Ignavibacteria bacterium]